MAFILVVEWEWKTDEESQAVKDGLGFFVPLWMKRLLSATGGDEHNEAPCQWAFAA